MPGFVSSLDCTLLCSAKKLYTQFEKFYPRLGGNMCTCTSLFITTLEWGGKSHTKTFNLYDITVLLLSIVNSIYIKLKAELLKVILEGEWDMSGIQLWVYQSWISGYTRLILIVISFTGCWASPMIIILILNSKCQIFMGFREGFKI